MNAMRLTTVLAGTALLPVGWAVAGVTPRLDPGAPTARWCTFLGGEAMDTMHAHNSIVLDERGYVLTGGSTESPDFPTASGYDMTYNGQQDAFLAIFDKNRDGPDQLIYGTFYGGSGLEEVHAVGATEEGLLYVAGYTTSTDLPTTPNAICSTHMGGDWDAFLAVFDPLRDGEEQLLFGTYLGGSADDWINEVIFVTDAPRYSEIAWRVGLPRQGERAVTPVVLKAIILGGGTSSADFPVFPGAYDATYNGGYDGWIGVLRFQQDTRATYPSTIGPRFEATYLGGTQDEWVIHLKLQHFLDWSSLVATGRTASTDFPTTPMAFDETYNGGNWDGYLVRLHPNLQLVYASTFIGGGGDDVTRALAFGQDGSVYVGGETRSPDLPVGAEGLDPTFNGFRDGMVMRFDPWFTTMMNATFLGSPGDDYVWDMTFDSLGALSIVGGTDDELFPTTPDAEQQFYNGGETDSFFTRLNPALDELHYSTFVGGNAGDQAYVVVSATCADVTLGGVTDSPDFPTTPLAYDQVLSGECDGFVATIDLCPADLDDSAVVDTLDFLQLLAEWGQVDVQSDFDGDGVGTSDMLTLLNHWGPCV